MISSAIVERYARAIFELGVESGQLEHLSAQLRDLSALFATSRERRMVGENPLIPDDQRDAVLKELGGRLGVGDLALNTVRLLARRRRLSALPDIAKRLGGLADEKAGEALKARVEKSARADKIQSTPTFFVNGKMVKEGEITLKELDAAIAAASK